MMAHDLTIRPARPDDRPAMERICAHTWEWGDYIPEVWDDWLAGEASSRAGSRSMAGPAIVGEMAGQVVALSKSTVQTPDQVWLEGMRVDPEFRRRGIAGHFVDYCLAYAREHGARVVRMGTGDHNTAIHTLMARASMERVGIYALRNAEPLTQGPRPSILAAEQAGQVAAFLRDSPVLDYTHGLFNFDWVWQELSAERVAHFLGNSQMAARLAADGSMTALATIHFTPGDTTMWVGFADGQPSSVAELATAIRVQAAQTGAEGASTMLPDLPWLRDAFGAAGYEPGDWEGELWIFERRLRLLGEGQHDG
jgi:ribosomal protein S18 acetylase RimI-like enzyme